MAFSSWLRGLTHGFTTTLKKPRPTPAPPRGTRRRLALEPLEDRLCPSSIVLDLGTLGGTYSDASAVNASGQVVGMSYTAAGAGSSHAVLWQNGAMTDLGTLGGATSSAGDINAAGQIVGSSRITADSTVNHAFLWSPTVANGTSGSMTDLGTLGGTGSNSGAINNHGQIVGFSRNAGGDFRTFVWENGVMYDLDALLPANSGWVTQAFDGVDINDNGQIAGTGSFNGVQRAFLISDNDGTFANGGLTITNLGTLGGASSQGYGINSSGQVVGWSNVARDGSPHACLFSGGVVTDLKTLGGSGSYAYAINDAGQIVGTSNYQRQGSFDPNHAVIWQNGRISDLNKQLPRGSSWVLESAYDINGTGKIVGQGTVGGQRHAFLMIPSGSALQVVAAGITAGTHVLIPNQIQPLFTEALARWQAAGVDTSSLSGIDVRIADLGGTTLGLAVGHTIYLDDNAAGWGWFVDPTPGDDSEFTTAGNQGEQHRMDLLTVLEHEVGHLLGHEHEQSGIMQETLSAGERLTPQGVNVNDYSWLIGLPELTKKLDPFGWLL